MNEPIGKPACADVPCDRQAITSYELKAITRFVCREHKRRHLERLSWLETWQELRKKAREGAA